MVQIPSDNFSQKLVQVVYVDSVHTCDFWGYLQHIPKSYGEISLCALLWGPEL